jgi:UDP-GlcNAc:undecaprenyl-phosphate GlcNAc-1-phosphate transferase
MIIAALIIAFVISFILTVPTIFLAKKFNLVTDRKKRVHPAHTHTGIVPRGGGVPIYLSLLLTSFIFLPFNKIVFGILLAGSLLVLIGLVDDYLDVSPYFRFVANILISGLVIAFGIGIPYISNPFGGVIHLDQWQLTINFFGRHDILYVADLLAILWLTWCMNMVNWSKGVDGQLPGFVAITAIFLGIISQRFTAHDISVQTVTILSFIVAGSYLGFLPFNFYPQKIMPGYGGGALAGFMLGILSILSFGKLGTLILVLAVPMIDAIYTMMRRIKNHRSPFKADWGHFHHKLLEIGWGKRKIALFYWSISFILGLLSLVLKGVEKLIAFILVGICLLTIIFFIELIKKERFARI